VALAALAPPVATNLRPSGGESMLAPLSTGCARCARFTRGNHPPPLRGGRSVRVSRSNASFRHWQATFVAPEGRWTVATGGANPEGERNPWKWPPQDHWPPRRGGGNARRARRGGGARRAGRLLRPSGAVFIWAPLTTGCARCARSTRGNQPPPLRGGLNIGDAFHGLRSLRSLHPWQHSFAPPGRPDPCASAVQARRFFTDERISTPRRGAGLLPRVERTRRVSATRGSGRRNIGRPGGAEETRGGQGAAEAPGASGVSSAPPGRSSIGATFHGLRSLRSLHPWQPTSAPPGRSQYRRRFPRVALAALASPVATFLRPSGAADPCASAVQTRPFVTGKRPSSPRRGAGL